MDFESDMRIDPDALDVELLRQPRLAAKYGEEGARARVVADRLKERVDVVRAELGLKIRRNPSAYGVEKLTEGTIDAVIVTDPEYREAVEALSLANEKVGLITAATRAVDHKRDALEYLVRLFGAQYFAGPSIPRNLKEESERFEEAKQKSVSEEIHQRLNPKSRRSR